MRELKYACHPNLSVPQGDVTPRLTYVLFGCSLDDNALCGVDQYGDGAYTTEGIVALMDGVKNSNIQSLR